MTQLTNIAFRKLENGWTVKYHIKTDAGFPEPERGCSKETYAKDAEDVARIVRALIADHIT